MRQLSFNFSNPIGVSARATIRIRAQIPGDASRRLNLQIKAAKARINWVIAKTLVDITRSNFGPGGLKRPSPWPPYSRSYGKRHPGPPTLVRTGVLMGSIRGTATPQNATITAEGVRNYAAAHQFGVPHLRLPARPYFPVIGSGASYEVTGEARREVQAAVDAEMRKIFGSAM